MKYRGMLLAAVVVFVVLSFFPLAAEETNGAVRLAAIFGDNMVLQRGQPVPIWGWATPGATVTVTFAGQTQTADADSHDGKWLVRLDKLKASAVPQTLIVTAGETKIFTNILVGEVWLCSGQSNMEKPLGLQRGQKPCFNYEQELAAANYPNIRLFLVEKALAAEPLADLGKNTGWLECNSNSLDRIKFSAAGYFFGREIFTNLNVPVGLVESSWGGTRIEPWTPPAGFMKFPSLRDLATNSINPGKISNTRPRAIYNAMIEPIAGFAIRGALWYQGESNLMGTSTNNDYKSYETKMEALVGGWREIWSQGDFPFYFVQIAPYKYYGGRIRRDNSPEMLPEFWELQEQAARKIKNAEIVLTDDIVDNLNDIHPRDKQDVGHRLALVALAKTYGRKVVYSGPVFDKVKFKGNKAVLKFDFVDGGLASKDGKPLDWFSIAGADGRFVTAEARIVGKTVVVSAPGVEKPTAVRFGWDETAQPNFCNKAGLPAAPFRTDESD